MRAVGLHSARGLGVALAVAAAIAGCGPDDDDGSPQSAAAASDQAIRAVLDTFGQAIEDADGQAACASLAASTKAAFEQQGGGATCVELFSSQVSDQLVTEDTTPKIVAVDIEGDRAVVTARQHPGSRPGDDPEEVRTTRATLVQEDGAWKVEEWFRD